MLRISNQKACSIRILSIFMAVMILFCCMDFSFIYAENDVEYSNTLNEWYVQATWNNDSTEYNLSSSKSETLYPKLTVRYYVNTAQRTYQPGEVAITIPGIGGVKRGSIIKAETTTTQANTEWNLNYDSSTDTYIFTNKNVITEQQVKSGGFEMMWVLNSRECENGYTASNNPTFSIKSDGETESIILPELKFNYTSERDIYHIVLKRDLITSSEFESVAQGSNEKIWYKYTTDFNREVKARGIYKSDYFVKVNIDGIEDTDYESIEVYLSNGTRTNLTKIVDPETNQEVYGFYSFTDKNNVLKDTFYLGLPKSVDGKNILVQTSFIILYNDETEYVIQHRDLSEEIKEGILIDDSEGKVEEYGFEYASNDYWQTKKSTYDSSSISIYSNRLLSNELYNSKTISYTFTASTSRNYSMSSGAARAMARVMTFSLEPVDKSDFGANTPFQFIQGDDRVVVELANGAIRRLESDEYDFVYITIPKESVSHDYKVYVSDDCTKPFGEYTVYQEGKTSTTQSITVQLSGDVNAFYLAIEGVVGNYSSSISVGINFHLDWDKEQAKPESERINPEGKIANFSYFRMVYENSNGQPVNYASTDGTNYTGTYGLQIKADDEEYYGEYLYRKNCDVPLRTTVTNLSSSTSSVQKADIIVSENKYGGGYVFNTTTSGTIKADESGELKKFSIYAVLQNNDMRVDENLKDIVCSDTQILSGMTLSGSAKTVEGKTITNFSDYVSYEVRKTADGQTVVVANFDFTNTPLEISELTSVSMTFPVKISQSDYDQNTSHTYNVNSYTVVHDKGISKVSGKAIMSDIKDIDADGDFSEQIAYSSGINNLEDIVREWSTSSDKFVDTYLTNDYVHSEESMRTDVEAISWDGESDRDKYKYSYKLGVNLDSVTDAVIYDNIEIDSASEWHGTFLNVDTSVLQSIGIIPTVYYSSNEYTISSAESAIKAYEDTSVWTKMTQTGTIWTVPDGANVKSIAIHLAFTETVTRNIYAIVNMRTPQFESDSIGQKTYNSFSAVCTQSVGDTITTAIYPSGRTRVLLSEEKPKLIIHKFDESTGNVLTGAKFTIYLKDDEGNYTPVSGLENLEVGRTGQLVIEKGLEYDTEYYYRETTAPLGYEPDTEYHQFSISRAEETLTIDVFNTPLTGTLYFTKKDADHSEYSDDTEKGITSLEGAEYSLYKYDGTRLFVNETETKDGVNIYEYSTEGTVSDMVTGTNGFKLTNLPLGSYYIIETAAPSGYELNSQKISFTIQKNIAESGANEIKVSLNQKDTEKTASIKLIKTDSQNGDFLKGARFNLERLNSEGEWETVNTNITTNVMGELLIENIKFGTYRLKEINAPVGYELYENSVTESVVLDSTTVEKTFELTMQNDRKTGSVRMIKYSDDGKTPLAGAKYDLYMVVGEIDSVDGENNDSLIKRGLTTDTSGMTSIVSGLEWGTYYFVETYAPKGYNKSNDKISFEINAQNVDIQQDMTQTDIKILGSVKLTKTAADAVGEYAIGAVLPGVEFELYTKSGEQIKATYNSETKIYSYDPNGTESTFVTDENGTITVDKLPWDSYYFEETKALNGFALADKVRFTVNASNCNSVQEIECENKKVECSLKIVKEIDTSVEDFGTPTFLFKITKLDTDGAKTSTSYTKSLTIKSGISGSFTMLVDPGEYLIEEIKVARYNPKSVEIVAEETTTSIYTLDESVYTAKVTLSTTTDGEPETACVKFTNELYRYDKVSHNSSATNIIAANRKITGISAEYKNGEIPLNKTAETSTYTINKDDVTYKILYDDGSEEEITSTDERYTGFTPESFSVSNGINDAGQTFQQIVSYTDSTTGKIYKAQFDVEVAPLKVVESIKVIFKVDADNSCYFSIDGKRTTANVVYYNEDDNENKIAVLGKYYEPVIIDKEYLFYGWTDTDGNLIARNEEVLKEYLKTTDKTEITLYAKIFNGMIEDFNYTGNVQEFTAPYDGYYQMECWGASGGNTKHSTQEITVLGGKGAYTQGLIYLTKGTTLYIYVGGQASDDPNATEAGWNGGGKENDIYNQARSGGGATDIRLVEDTTSENGWSDFDSLKSRIMVAAGGGGSAIANTNYTTYVGNGGDGGKLEGLISNNLGSYAQNYYGTGATQTSAGYAINNSSLGLGGFGYGGDGSTSIGGGQSAGGGGGYYGGGGAGYCAPGGGGSSFISGYNGCDAISADSTSDSITHTGQAVHYSGMYFINGVMKAGNESMPDYNSDSTITGNESNGHARITYINPYSGLDYDYTGTIQTFTAPQSGIYQLETWGAQGGGSKTYADGNYVSSRQGFNDSGIIDVEGGRGGYTTANVYLSKGQTVYIAVGGMGQELYSYQGNSTDYIIENGLGFNGGGGVNPSDHQGDTYVGGGGGATHIALTLQGDGQLVNYESYQDDVLAVAGGGGGSGFYHHTGQQYLHYGLGGAGGGLISQGNHNNDSIAFGAVNLDGSTQTDSATWTDDSRFVKGSFGQGGKKSTSGGGGWYGGSAAGSQGSAGGSGHIGTGTISGETIAGTETFLAPDGTAETGHTGNGYARITYIAPCESKEFDYTGTIQTFTALQSGTYLLETWGASGGDAKTTESYNQSGGQGGYSTATVYLNKGDTLYICVGGQGASGKGDGKTRVTAEGGYNGGGNAYAGFSYSSDNYFGGGGGATHIASTLQGTGVLSDYVDNKDDVMLVAGGGGGAMYFKLGNYYHHTAGGAGGGLEGGDVVDYYSSIADRTVDEYGGKGGKQEADSKCSTFGQSTASGQYPSGGGGGGWYGGWARYGGGGGSGHIGTGTVNGKTIAGTETFLTPDGTTETGHTGNGYARITLIE